MQAKLNLKHKKGTGISPQAFNDGMTKNQEEFKSWYERFTWEGKEEAAFFADHGLEKGIYCQILCTDWCPDVIWNLPVLLRVLERASIPTEILPMEEHLETMDLFLINGGRNQPIAIFLNADGDVLGRWGARPQYIQAVMDEFRRQNPDREAPGYQEKVSMARKEIAKIYNAGTEYQNVVVQEVHRLIASFADRSENHAITRRP
ncbi:thioredoxin family protein [Brevibacillus fluminis]|uniref:Thioredoxin family protein n=1 Tax=Brevibacillus fluminis TaxID=511487 RepID=A0A3M8DRE9_9BACL|nr:thioredoxin family protein [Brevibacillus fluminis]RNB90554.1 thioredoxin family protein [Brevibacillus fluminis]